MRIADYLSCGQQNAIPLRRLAGMTGKKPRIVRKMIEAERRTGVLILSDNQNGYFLPGNLDELKRFSMSMARRANKIMSVAKTAEAAYVKGLGQQTMEGWVNG